MPDAHKIIIHAEMHACMAMEFDWRYLRKWLVDRNPHVDQKSLDSLVAWTQTCLCTRLLYIGQVLRTLWKLLLFYRSQFKKQGFETRVANQLLEISDHS